MLAQSGCALKLWLNYNIFILKVCSSYSEIILKVSSSVNFSDNWQVLLFYDIPAFASNGQLLLCALDSDTEVKH